MPSQPNPDSPFLANRLQATFGVRAPGTPSATGSPTMQAGGATQFPAPPAVAQGIPGRPSTPQAPTPSAPVAATPTPAQQTPQAKVAPGTPAADKTGAQAVPQAGAAPLGIPAADGGLALTPEGDMRYREAVLRGRDQLGPIPRLFRHASLPPMPFELGKRNYNPFTGAWGDGSAQ